MARHVFRALVFAASLSFVAAFAWAAVEAIRAPAPADAFEQTILEQSQRFARHDFRRVAPADPAVPVLMPAFPGLAASLVGVDQPRLELLRTLALTATLFTVLLLLALVHFETGSWTLAIAASSLSLLGQGLFATPPGVARPEAFVFLFVLLAFAALRVFVGLAGSIVAGALIALASFFSPIALVFLGAALVSQALDERRRLWTLAVVASLVVAAGTVVMSTRLDPAFHAAWAGPFAALSFDGRATLAFASTYLLGKFGLFFLVAVLSCALSSQPWRDREGLWIWLGVGAIAAGLLSTQAAGADRSPLLASVVALALIGTLALQRVVHHLSDRAGGGPASGEAVMMAVLVIQFLVLASFAADVSWVRSLALRG